MDASYVSESESRLLAEILSIILHHAFVQACMLRAGLHYMFTRPIRDIRNIIDTMSN